MNERFSGGEVVEDFTRPSLQTARVTIDGVMHLGGGWGVRGSVPLGWLEHDGDVGLGPQTISGLGDIRLGGMKDVFPFAKARLRFGVDTILPTGQQQTVGVLSSTSMPTVVALGTGAFGLGARAGFTWMPGRIGLQVPLRLLVPLTHASNRVRQGLGVFGGVSGLARLPGDLLVQLGATFRWRGRAQMENGNTVINSGGTLVAAQLGLWLPLGETWALQASGRVPLWRDLGGTQLSEAFVAGLGVVWQR